MIKLEYKEPVYEVWDTDGYRQNRIVYFTKEEDASKLVKRLNGGKEHGYYGYTAKNLPSTVIFESITEYEDSKYKTIKEKALAKLTKEEKQALGLL